MIPYGRQSISDDDISEVIDVLRSDWLTQGPNVGCFEQVVADYCGVRYAIAVSNGTAALHVACLAAGLGTGDVLWTSPNTFVASANCARYVGADVDFVDIDPDTLNMSADALELKLRTARNEGARLPKVVVPVDFGGLSCDMNRISSLAREYDFTVLEDASHAIGGRYLDLPVGSCSHSDMATFSFHPVKIVTTAEGGMIVTNDDALAERLRLFRSHGITRDPALVTGDPEGIWYYEQVTLGYNYRMTDIQAALGASQMKRIDAFVDRRNVVAARYREAFAQMPIGTQAIPSDCASAYHLFVIRVDAAVRAHVFSLLWDAGIAVNVHYIPVHMQPYYRNLGFQPGDFPEAERYYSEAMSIPDFPALTDGEQTYVIQSVHDALEAT